MGESKESYQIRASDIQGLLQTLNFHMARIADRLDALEGHRDRPTFYKNPKLNEGTALRMIKTDSDKIIIPQDQFSTPASVSLTNDVSGSGTVDVDALNAILDAYALIFTDVVAGMEGAEIFVSDPPEVGGGGVTFGGATVTMDGEETTW